MEPHVAAITAAQLSSQVILTVQALADLSKDYPDQVRAAQGLFMGEQKRILVVLTNSHFLE